MTLYVNTQTPAVIPPAQPKTAPPKMFAGQIREMMMQDARRIATRQRGRVGGMPQSLKERGDDAGKKRKAMEDTVVAFIGKHGPSPTRDLADACNIRMSTFSNYIQIMTEKGLIVSVKRAVYDLPKDAKQ
jgi:predicted transcriptional regulator